MRKPKILYIEHPCEDGVQHFYDLSRVQLVSTQHKEAAEIWVIFDIISSVQFEVVNGEGVMRTVDLTMDDVRCYDIPEEVHWESRNNDRVAPYRISDELVFASDAVYWNFQDAIQAATERSEDICADTRILNAYMNDIEDINYVEEE